MGTYQLYILKPPAVDNGLFSLEKDDLRRSYGNENGRRENREDDLLKLEGKVKVVATALDARPQQRVAGAI